MSCRLTCTICLNFIEGKFALAHSRVQTHAESIAFFGGGSRENEFAERHFTNLMDLIWSRLKV